LARLSKREVLPRATAKLTMPKPSAESAAVPNNQLLKNFESNMLGGRKHRLVKNGYAALPS
jgi:hypothetical protein